MLSNPTLRQFARFVAVGLVNTGFGYLVYAALVMAGLSPQPALALAFAIGVIWNYWTHASLVFGQRGLRRLPAYVGCYLLIYGVNSAALAAALRIGMGALAAQALLAPFAACLSFLLIRRVLTNGPVASGPEA